MTERAVDFYDESSNAYVDWAIRFEDLAVAFPRRGRPGVSYQRCEWDGWEVNCLLYRDESGHLSGVHLHYPRQVGESKAPGVSPGYTETLVRADQRHKGIGTLLLGMAVLRFGVDLERQRYTRAGYALATRVREILRTRSPYYSVAFTLDACRSNQQKLVATVLNGPAKPLSAPLTS